MPDDRPYANDHEEYQDEAYFDAADGARRFDSHLLREPVTILPKRKPVLLSPMNTVTDAMRAMKGEHCGAVVVTGDGSAATPVSGIFTERDVLFRIVDGGRNPATLALGDVMTQEPECLQDTQTIAEALNMMSVGGFRNIPVVDAERHPRTIISVREVVQFLVESFPQEVLNLGGDRQRQREGG